MKRQRGIRGLRNVALLVIVIVGGPLGAMGCAKDTRPNYAAPSLPPDQIVTVKGVKGVFVDAIDGARVKNSGVTFMGIVGGNSVTMSPGEHALDVKINTSNFNSRSKFNYTFDAGTSYELAPNSVWFPRDVDIKNLKTGVTTEIR
jgi:hypothetical protein